MNNTNTPKNAASVMERILTKNASHLGKTPASPAPFNTRVAPESTLSVPALGELNLLLHALKAPARPAQADAPLQTLMAIVLDESGSMDTGCQQTMTGYNEQLATIRKNASEIGCRVMQIAFNSRARLIAEDVGAEMVVPLSAETYSPGGGTALYDTVAATVKKLLSHPLANDDNTSILLTITTDGDDQSSTVWKSTDMQAFRHLMAAVHKNERWTVALTGPDTNLRQFSDEMSVDFENVAAFKPESVVSRGHAMASSVMAMDGFMTLRSTGMKKSHAMYAGTVSGASAKSILEGKDPAA